MVELATHLVKNLVLGHLIFGWLQTQTYFRFQQKLTRKSAHNIPIRFGKAFEGILPCFEKEKRGKPH